VRLQTAFLGAAVLVALVFLPSQGGGDAPQGEIDPPASGNEGRAVRVDPIHPVIGATGRSSEDHHVA
jgi:hypothetical protein